MAQPPCFPSAAPCVRASCGAPGHPGARLEGAGVLLGRFRLRGVAESEDRDLDGAGRCFEYHSYYMLLCTIIIKT